MKHNIRINGQIQTIDCELGSDILDKNGREIFEGDMVIVNSVYRGDIRCLVRFNGGAFPLCRYVGGRISDWCSIGGAHAFNNTLLKVVDD